MATKAVKVSVYAWEGVDKKGTKLTGEITGHNPALVKAQLRKQGVNPEEIGLAFWQG
jgi:type IV pilus assembly protein PilC